LAQREVRLRGLRQKCDGRQIQPRGGERSSIQEEKKQDPGVMLGCYRSQASLAISLILAVIWMGAISYGVLKIVW
jgi:hypothetical protein